MSEAFLSQVRRAIETLPVTFEFLDGQVSTSFGDAHAEFKYGNVKMRILRDRGQVFVEIASCTDGEWWPLEFVCELAGERIPNPTLADNIQCLKQSMVRIVHDFDQANFDHMRTELNRLQQARLDRELGDR